MSSLATIRLAALAALSLISAHAAVFDFESVPSGAVTTFTVTEGGITATFTVSSGAFFVAPGFFATLSGQVLLDMDPALHTLSITFSQPLSGLSLVFALNNSLGLGQLTLTAYSGGLSGAVVGSVSASGTVPDGFDYPEGSLTFSGPTFDAITLQSDQQDFAIDNLTVHGVGGPEIPEPSTVALVLIGLVGALARRRW